MKTQEKINFTMTVPISLCINMDMVLKCKLGHLVPMDFSKFRQIIFLQPDYHSTVECLRNLGIEAMTLKDSPLREKI